MSPFLPGPLHAGPSDVLIRNGRIVDGSGNAWFRGDVAISGDAIVGIAPRREKKVLSLEEAVRKMSSFPAARAGIPRPRPAAARDEGGRQPSQHVAFFEDLQFPDLETVRCVRAVGRIGRGKAEQSVRIRTVVCDVEHGQS